MRAQDGLLSALIALASLPAMAHRPGATPSGTRAMCPPVVEDFLEAIGLLPDLPTGIPPVVLIDVQGHPLDCLPRTLPVQVHVQAAELRKRPV